MVVYAIRLPDIVIVQLVLWDVVVRKNVHQIYMVQIVITTVFVCMMGNAIRKMVHAVVLLDGPDLPANLYAHSDSMV